MTLDQLMGMWKPKMAIFSNKKRLLALGLGHQPINKAFDLQSFLSAIYFGAKVAYNLWNCSTHDWPKLWSMQQNVAHTQQCLEDQ